MKKLISTLLVAALVAVPVSGAYAATLTASCAGAQSGTSVTWTGQATGGVSPYTYLWSNGATALSQSLLATPGTTTLGFQVTDASSTVATTTCTTVVPAAVVPVKRNQMLHIEGNGQFQAKGMVVKSVGTGSFTAEVFGITYTIKSTQVVTVGNYVEVVGRLSDTSPLSVDARKVKERPATKVVTTHSKAFKWFKNMRDDSDDDRRNGKGRGHSEDD